MIAMLAPATPYEHVIAEELVDISWELLQHRRMRDTCIRREIHDRICAAVVAQREAAHEAAHEAAIEEALEKHAEAGGSDRDWEEPADFDRDAAARAAKAFAERAMSGDPKVRAKAEKEIAALGLKPVELMSLAYTAENVSLIQHQRQIEDLERRRRELKRDFDVLQKARSSDVRTAGARVIDA